MAKARLLLHATVRTTAYRDPYVTDVPAFVAELGLILLRNWIFLLIPISELELNWLNPVRAELELPSIKLELECTCTIL